MTTETVPPGVSDRWSPYPFAYKAAQYRGSHYTDALLAWHRQDARNASVAMRGMGPDASGNSPSNWYADDAATIASEIERRSLAARLRKPRK